MGQGPAHVSARGPVPLQRRDPDGSRVRGVGSQAGKTVRLDPASEAEVRVAYHQGLLSRSSLNWFQWWALCYHLSFANRRESERQKNFLDSILRGSTRIFKPEAYDNFFPPTPLEQALKDTLADEENVSPDDFDSIDQFIKGLDNLKSSTILGEDEGWM